jgi:LPXTG-site transpeptidase (sortase) family protein
MPPGPVQPAANGSDPAVELIRQKIQNLYADEPSAAVETIQAAQHTHPGSKHQQYMNELNASGMSLTELQAAWHNYYSALPDHEKYEVWQEFYVTNGPNPLQQLGSQPAPGAASAQPGQPEVPQQPFNPFAQQQPAVPQSLPQPQQPSQPFQAAVPPSIPGPTRRLTKRNRSVSDILDQAADRAREGGAATVEQVSDIRKKILHTVKSASPRGGGKPVAKSPLHSLFFGLGCGLVVMLIFLFSFFNELIISPFIQPSRNSNDTPVIVDAASTVVAGGPKVLIPKINVEIPVDYSQKTTDEKQIELALDNGVVHYPTTVRPGQVGNAAYFGHSSNNIFNPGKYKFAFVLLHELVEGDTFYLTNDGKTYAYRVFSKRIVRPTEVSVLGPVAGHPSTATLITCDPPGTSINRLVVVGDQISPDSSGNPVPAVPAETPVQTASQDSGLPGNGPTLWSRFWGSIF